MPGQCAIQFKNLYQSSKSFARIVCPIDWIFLLNFWNKNRICSFYSRLISILIVIAILSLTHTNHLNNTPNYQIVLTENVMFWSAFYTRSVTYSVHVSSFKMLLDVSRLVWPSDICTTKHCFRSCKLPSEQPITWLLAWQGLVPPGPPFTNMV